MQIVPFSDLARSFNGVRYQINRFKHGFEVVGKDRCPVRVTLEPTHLSLVSEQSTARCGLFEYRALIQWVANAAMRRWGSISPWAVDTGPAPRWMRQITEKAMNARIHPLWQELLKVADPSVVAVQRRMFAATGDCSWKILSLPALYRQRYLVADISRFPAAAIAAASVQWLSLRVPWILDRYPYAAQRRRVYDAWRRGMGAIPEPAELRPDDPQSISLWIEMLQDWRALFAPAGRTYTSLNKTLMRLPGGITCSTLCALGEIALQRPVTDRLELITLGTSAQCRRRHHEDVFAHAQHDEIVQAMSLVAEDRNRGIAVDAPGYLPLSPRRTRDIAFFTRYLSDFPERHAGRIVGLARKAVEWHRADGEQQVRKSGAALGHDRLTLLPPIPLPDLPGIRFLSTVGEICEEGQQMRHCVASYAHDAVRGACFLFHVEHAGEMATVEVCRSSKVLQAQGPRNSHNAAVVWGRQTLQAWAASFPAPSLLESAEAPRA